VTGLSHQGVCPASKRRKDLARFSRNEIVSQLITRHVHAHRARARCLPLPRIIGPPGFIGLGDCLFGPGICRASVTREFDQWLFNTCPQLAYSPAWPGVTIAEQADFRDHDKRSDLLPPTYQCAWHNAAFCNRPLGPMLSQGTGPDQTPRGRQALPPRSGHATHRRMANSPLRWLGLMIASAPSLPACQRPLCRSLFRWVKGIVICCVRLC